MQLVLESTTKLPYKKLQYPTYVKNTDLDAHIKVFKKAIKVNGEMVEVNIINLFGFTFRGNISKWGENYVQDHPNCTFEKLEQSFYKWFRTLKNDEEFYMQLQNIQHQIVECVEVYYEYLLKLTNYLRVITTKVFFTTIFRVGLLPYLRLTTTSMKRNTLIEHKEVVIVCEENTLVSLNYNVLLTTPKTNIEVKPIILVVTSKSTLTCTNCGKINHLVETRHNRKRKVFATIKQELKPNLLNQEKYMSIILV